MSDEISYLDFEMTVEKAGKDKYLIRAESADQTAEVSFTNPFNEDKRAIINATLTKAALRRTAKTRGSSAPEVQQMKKFGAVLFEHAIRGPVRDFYDKCQSQADNDRKGIRWRLALDRSVDDLPWEFLCLRDQFLALNPRSPIVRYIKPDTWIAPLASEHPLRLLVVIASPGDEVPLDTDAEKERITAALKPLTDKGQVRVSYIEGPNTWEQLINKLLRNDTHILHFIGHGAFDQKNSNGVLVMEDIDGKAMRIDSERLSVLVQGKSRLRLIVLNSCLGTMGDEVQPFSSVAAGMVRSGIPAVIAMQFEISDEAARDIAETFYTSLALNMPVDAALTEARRKIYLTYENSLEWATPILYMQVPDGQLFQFTIKETTLPPDMPPPTIRGAMPAVAMLVRTDTRAEIPLNLELIKLGRGSDNDVNLPDLTISRKHAILTRTGSTYMIQDIAGSSGTRVNGLQVTARRLKTNDVVRLGTVEFKFVSLMAAPARAETTQAPRSNETPATPPAGADSETLVRAPAIQPTPQPSGGGLRSWYEKANKWFASPVPVAHRSPQAPVSQPAQPSAPNPVSQPAERPLTSDFESRLYEIGKLDAKEMAEAVRQYFYNNGYESQMIQQNDTWIVQGRKVGLLNWIKMSQAGTVIIDPIGNNVRLLIGGGGWLERGAAWASSLYLKPEWVNNALGVAQQKQLLDSLWQMSESFVTSHGGKRIE